MDKAKLLFVAPYKEMADVARRVAPEYPDIDITIETGDLEGGLRVASATFAHNFDLIASRGGTLQILEEELNLPVVEIELSITDVFRQIQTIPTAELPLAAVGFRNALRPLQRARDILPYPVDIFPVDFSDEVPLALGRARARGCKTLLCDNYAYQLAREMGYQAQLLESGDDSIRDAFDRALQLWAQTAYARRREELLWGLVKTQKNRVVAFDETGALLYSALAKDEADVLDFCRRHAQDSSTRRLAMSRGGRIYSIKPMHVTLTGATIVAFGVTAQGKASSDRLSGITYMNTLECRQAYERSSFSVVGASEKLEAHIKGALSSQLPLLIRGEKSCGKSQIAQLAYLNAYVSGPMVRCDCAELSPTSLSFLLNSHNSPLFLADNFIFIKEVQKLEPDQLEALLSTIQVSGCLTRNMVVISGSDRPDALSEALDMCGERLHCFPLVAPVLRKQGAGVVRAAKLWLERRAELAGTSAPRLSDDACKVLQQERWPDNFLQLRRVIDWVFATADSPTISASAIQLALERYELARYAADDADSDTPTLDLGQPLSTIERQIAHIVLASCKQNKTRAAESLGISRTTLWRLLRDDAQPRA